MMARRTAADSISPQQMSQAAMKPSQRYPVVDLSDPGTYHRAVQNIVNLHDATPDELKRAGGEWYGRVHEAVAKGVRGTSMSHLAGSGVVAAVSPGMDFERNNIHAFGELKGLKQADWDTIARSAQNKVPTVDSAGRRRTVQQRTGEARSVLQGLSVSRASDPDLMKAYRIMNGEHVDDVLNRSTGAPKTNSFAHNIHDPDNPHGPVTIDGRAYDIATNAMRPWNFSGRGISSASLKTGRKTRYEHAEDAYREAAGIAGVSGAPHMQAITWLGGQHVERQGGLRTKGVARRGQPYLGEGSPLPGSFNDRRAQRRSA